MLKIKLSRTGKRGYATYNIVIAEAKSKRDGRYTDLLGTYNPNLKPKEIKLDQKKLKTWLAKGAQPTITVRRLIKKYGHTG
ncbi:MAG TPA: 30S ribosomal protein S16 [Patescibacteria group bacterium]|nr:30S ribosomal protein S16 [Patescibacteria group bacterium]